MEIVPAFPIPIGLTELGRSLTEQELRYIDSLKTKSHAASGNRTTDNKYILDKPHLRQLKSELESFVSEFFHLAWSPKNNSVDVYITQSWLTWIGKGQFHTPHSHPNSLISGTFYVQSGPNDAIAFNNDRNARADILIFEETTNQYNCLKIVEPTPAGSIKLFPSKIFHEVSPKEDDYSRCCLAFNTWMKGTIGSSETSTELIL